MPSALGRFGDGTQTMLLSARGAKSMRGGLAGVGRKHLTVRHPDQPFFGDWPISETVELATEELSPTFDEPGQVIESFKNALAGNEVIALAGLLGLKAEKILDDGAALEAFVAIRNGVAEKLEIDEQRGRQILLIGNESWPFPYPVARDEDGMWSFGTMAGLEEIVNRRIGENELEAIATLRAYLAAQRAYASQDRDGDGVLEYAQNLTSSKDQTDGLYWPTSQANGESPGGEFLPAAAERTGYYGYRFKILKGQGENVQGGSYNYVINGNMVAGYALLAWPARYAKTGLKTFMVNQNGEVHEADLGNPTDLIVKYINQFDPNEDWEMVTGQ
jgi:Protein of unknown function (DUF2950)